MLSKKALESSKSYGLKKFRKFLNFKNLQVKCLIEFHHSPKCPFKTPNIRSIPSFFFSDENSSPKTLKLLNI